MKFFHITKIDTVSSHKDQSAFFSAACQDENIEYVRLIITEMAPLDFLELSINPGDIVYRSAAGTQSKTLEKLLISDQTRTIYQNNHTVLTGKGGSYLLMKKAGVPVIPAVPFLSRKKRDALALTDHLGGFPVVIKVMGGMEGVGVIRVDSIESFNSVADFIRKDELAEVNVMEYIPHTHYARLVVVGSAVVAATKEGAPLGDFRANAHGPRTEKGVAFEPSAAMIADAVKCADALGVKATGVDFLLTEDGYYIAEANAPFNFAETQNITGINIAKEILRELIR